VAETPTQPGTTAPKPPATLRRRDAAKTRQLLLDAARRRFAADGYAATTVRDIADDAGVNVALISRYFDSKEGLFAACLGSAADDFRRTTGDVPLEQVAAAIAGQVAGHGAEGLPNQLALLLRSSGDARAEEVQLGVLRTSAQRLASTGGWRSEELDGTEPILRAQILLAATLGIAVLRSSTGLEPLGSATEEELVEPLRALVKALMGP
jgi:AcrR family transcriptional regulator